MDHTLPAEDYTGAGRAIECRVQARALRWCVAHRVLIDRPQSVGMAHEPPTLGSEPPPPLH